MMRNSFLLMLGVVTLMMLSGSRQQLGERRCLCSQLVAKRTNQVTDKAAIRQSLPTHLDSNQKQ